MNLLQEHFDQQYSGRAGTNLPQEHFDIGGAGVQQSQLITPTARTRMFGGVAINNRIPQQYRSVWGRVGCSHCAASTRVSAAGGVLLA